MVVPQLQSARDAVCEAAEMTPHTLPDRFQRLEAGGARMGMDADALS